jgi:hypothetical protein
MQTQQRRNKKEPSKENHKTTSGSCQTEKEKKKIRLLPAKVPLTFYSSPPYSTLAIPFTVPLPSLRSTADEIHLVVVVVVVVLEKKKKEKKKRAINTAP